MMTIYQILHHYAVCSRQPLDIEILLASVLQVSRSYLYTFPERALSEAEQLEFANVLQRYQAFEPIAYILGRREFWSLELSVNPDTLIPRQETELLVELALSYGDAQWDLPITVADLGTGSGAIALALAYERPTWAVYATDQSGAALNVAQANAERLQLNKIIFARGNWCEALPSLKFNLLISNPPYIAENDPHLQQKELSYEPASALISGEQGLEAINLIIAEAVYYLKPKGWLLLEHGFQQAEAVRDQFLKWDYTNVITKNDLFGLQRATLGQFKGS